LEEYDEDLGHDEDLGQDEDPKDDGERKYDKDPEISLNKETGHGIVKLFRGGQMICYRVFVQTIKDKLKIDIKFAEDLSGRYDGGLDGADEVNRMYIGDGRRYVYKLVEEYLNPPAEAEHG